MSLTQEEVDEIIANPSILNSLALNIMLELRKSVKDSNTAIRAFIQSELSLYSDEYVDSSDYSSSSTGVNGSMRLSAEGLNNIANNEGFRDKAYRDKVATSTFNIGYGHQIKRGEEYLYDTTLTKEEAKILLRKDVRSFEKYVKQDIKKKLTQGQFDSLVDMYYQFGPGTYPNPSKGQNGNGIKRYGPIRHINQNGITGDPDIDLASFLPSISDYPSRKNNHWALWRK